MELQGRSKEVENVEEEEEEEDDYEEDDNDVDSVDEESRAYDEEEEGNFGGASGRSSKVSREAPRVVRKSSIGLNTTCSVLDRFSEKEREQLHIHLAFTQLLIARVDF